MPSTQTDTLLRAENVRLRGALQQIAGIENEMSGGDWDEIERAREVATAALGAPPPVLDQGPTLYIDRFRQVLTLLAGGKAPSLEDCDKWLRNISEGSIDPLQEWAVNNVVVGWAQGIGAIDAARTLADQPAEGVEHQSFDEAYPAEVDGAELADDAAAAETVDEWLARMHVAIKNFHTHDFGAGPVLHPDCISDALRKGLARGTAAEAADAADGAATPNDLEANIRSLLDGCPFTVRDLSGERTGMRGREDLAGSLAITFLGMQGKLTDAVFKRRDVQYVRTGRSPVTQVHTAGALAARDGMAQELGSSNVTLEGPHTFLNVSLPGAVVEEVARAAGMASPLSERLHQFSQDLKYRILALVPKDALAEAGDARAAQTLREFKNFHRGLCERFGYTHDARDWKRDQVSLEEHIAKLTAGAAV